MAATKDVNFTVGADTSQFIASLSEAKAASSAAASGIKETFEGVQSTFEKVGAAFLAFTAVLAGGRAFKEMIDATVQTNFAAQELGRQMGITATQAGVLRVAMDENFISTEQMETATAKITTTMRKHEDAFVRLGVATRDTNGDYRNTFDVMQDVNAALLKLKEGTDRNVEGQLIYGKGWATVERSILVTKDSMAAAAQTAEELNLTVSKEGVEATNRYKVAMAEAHETVEGIYKTIGDALMPVLTDLAVWFREHGPQAIEYTKKAIASLIVAFSGLKNSIEILFDVLLGVAQEVGDVFITLGRVIDRVIHLDFAGAKAAWSKGWDDLSRIANDRIADIKRHAADFSMTAGDAFDHATDKSKGTATTERSGKASDYEDPAASKAAYNKLLANLDEDELERTLKAQEAAYRLAAQKRRELYAVTVDGARDRALGELAVEEESAQESYKSHQTKLSEYIAQLREFEDRKYAIQAKALADQIELANLDPSSDPVKTAQLYASLEKLASQHALAMEKINSYAADEGRKQWKTIFGEISDAFANSIQKMFTSTQGFAAGLRGLFLNMTSAIAQSFVGMAAKNIATMLEQAAVGKGIKLQEMYANAKSAATGAYSAVAGIPYVGPFLAPAAAAAAFAGTMAFASAEGGYDIPSGVNPVVQTHAREMILPAKQADAVRSMAEGGGAGGHLQLKLSPLGNGYFITRDNLAEHLKKAYRSHSLQGAM